MTDTLHVFDSVEQMISAEGLTAILGGAVEAVERRPLEVEHYSGNTLEQVCAVWNGQPVRFVLKRFSLERDWIMRLTHDTAVREVALYRGGVYQRLPEVCRVPVIAAARDGQSWASLMTDVSDWLAAPSRAPLPASHLRRYLAHLAALHAHFMNDETLLDPALGLSSLEDFITILSPAVARREVAEGRSHPVLERAIKGWQIFEGLASPEAVQVVKQAQANPRPLLNMLAHAPRTLVHGDYKFANLGSHAASSSEPRTLILDWQDAAFGPPLLDLGYFLAVNSVRFPISKEAAIQIYRDALAAQGFPYPLEGWERDLALGLLAGGALRLIWQKALGAESADPAARERERAELRWWSEQIIRADRWLG